MNLYILLLKHIKFNYYTEIASYNLAIENAVI